MTVCIFLQVVDMEIHTQEDWISTLGICFLDTKRKFTDDFCVVESQLSFKPPADLRFLSFISIRLSVTSDRYDFFFHVVTLNRLLNGRS